MSIPNADRLEMTAGAVIDEQVFDAIAEAAREGRHAPTQAALADRLGRKPAEIREALFRLIIMDRIRRLSSGPHLRYSIVSLGIATAEHAAPMEEIRDDGVKVYPPKKARGAGFGTQKGGRGMKTLRP